MRGVAAINGIAFAVALVATRNSYAACLRGHSDAS
jgi:hypothetical protein